MGYNGEHRGVITDDRQDLLDAIGFGIAALDGLGSVRALNRPWRELMASADLHAGGGPAYTQDGHTAFAAAETPLARAVSGQVFEELVAWFGEPGAARLALSFSSRGIGGRDAVVVVRDVTRELESARAREEFIASVSHEFRTPLTSVIGYLDLVLDADMDEKTRELIEIAARSANRLQLLVSDLLMTASMDSGRLVLNIEECDFTSIVSHSIDAFRLQAADRGIDLELSVEDEVTVMADGHRIRQVVDNLISNAIKYNREHGEVYVEVEEYGDQARIAVTDRGQGLSEDEQRQLFDRYYRSDSARRSAIYGTGLGLSISRDIVRLHGGELMVTSVVGEGSTFVVTLPIQRAGVALL